MSEISDKCLAKQEELLEKYFGNLVREAAVERPETIGDYTQDLPLKIEAEYYDFLKELWTTAAAEDRRPFEEIIDKRHLRTMMTEDDREGLKYAYDDAQRITLRERITRSNHKDVTYYKGLLRVYTEELLNCLRTDFLEEFR